MTRDNENKNCKAWVVFSPQADMAWLKLLKPGFRHCSLLLNDGQQWITYDPLSSFTDINVHDVPQDFDLAKWMRARGHIVIAAPLKRDLKAAPWGIFSCVEAVKRALGLHKRFIFTPWQLYRHLTKTEIQNNNKNIIKGEIAWEV